MSTVFPHTLLDYRVELRLGGAWVDMSDWVDADTPVTIVRGLQDWAGEPDAGTCNFTLIDTDPPSGRWAPDNPMGPHWGNLGLNTPVRVKVIRATGEYWRFAGEIASLGPAQWDEAGVRVVYPVEAAGIFRRLGKWDDPIRSVLRREITRVFTASELRAYWPLEDPAHRRRPAAGLSTHGRMGIRSTRGPDFASYGGFDASAPILTLRDADLNGRVPRYAYVDGASVWQVGFLLHVGDAGSTNGQTILHVNTSEVAAQWEVNYLEASNGSLRLRVRNSSGSEILLTGALHTQVNGKDLHVSLRATRSGSNINWTLHTLVAGASVGSSASGSIGGNVSLGRVTDVRVNFEGGHDDVSVGHIYVLSAPHNFLLLSDLLAAYEHEPAGRRIQRLCGEYGIGFTWPGAPDETVLDDTERVGPQLAARFVDLIREAATADGGRLYEPTETVGNEPAVGFRPRATLWSQPAAVALSYPAEQLTAPLQPVPDDQDRVNLVTASGPRGEEAVELRNGRYGTRKPPLGIGEYPGAIAANLPEGRLANAAHHHMVRGTTPEARYPLVHLEMKHLAGDAALTHAILSARLGDRLTISGMPVWTQPDPVSQLIEGISQEEISLFDHRLSFVCAPEGPYRGAVFAGGVRPTVASVGSAAAGTASVSPGLPAGTQVGDVLVLLVETAAQALPVMTGWAEAPGSPVTQGTATSGTRLTVRWRAHTGGGAPSVPDSGDHQIARLIRFVDCDPVAPFAAGLAGTSGTSNTSVSFPAVSVPGGVTRSTVLQAVATTTDVTSTAGISGFTNSSLTHVTEVVDNWTDVAGGGGIGACVGYRDGSGGVGTTTATLAVAAPKAMLSLVLRPPLSALGDSRFDASLPDGTSASVLASGVGSSATSLSVSSAAGRRWTTDAAELPLDIVMGGERIRVTAISGTGSTQPFTVQRAMNSVVKSHSAGAPIVLADPHLFT